MTNFERIKQMSAKELAEWLLAEENKITESWCENRYCEDANGDCIVCITEWLNEVGTSQKEAEPKCMDLPKVSIQGAGNAEGQEMSGTVYKVMEEIEYKCEIGAIIALLRKLMMATQDYNIAHPKYIGVLVEDVLNFLIDAMIESLKKEKQEEEKC